MGELGLNKIFGAILATVLVIFALKEVTYIVFPSGDGHGGHHGEEHEMSLNEQIAERYAYYVEVADSSGGAAVVEEVFDLGLALASADPALGERAFRGKCVTCHTIEEGGANGTGPNLHAMMGAQKHSVDGFSYSNAMTQLEGAWTYENMSDWLENPAGYVRGTSMAFAGLRRDDERANVIAYLASYTPDAPAFPDPLPAESDSAEADGETEAADVIEAAATETVEAVEVVVEEAAAAADVVAEEATAATDAVVEETAAATEVVVEAAEDAVEAVEDTVEAVTDEAADAVEEATEEAPSEE